MVLKKSGKYATFIGVKRLEGTSAVPNRQLTTTLPQRLETWQEGKVYPKVGQ